MSEYQKNGHRKKAYHESDKELVASIFPGFKVNVWGEKEYGGYDFFFIGHDDENVVKTISSKLAQFNITDHGNNKKPKMFHEVFETGFHIALGKEEINALIKIQKENPGIFSVEACGYTDTKVYQNLFKDFFVRRVDDNLVVGHREINVVEKLSDLLNKAGVRDSGGGSKHVFSGGDGFHCVIIVKNQADCLIKNKAVFSAEDCGYDKNAKKPQAQSIGLSKL